MSTNASTPLTACLRSLKLTKIPRHICQSRVQCASLTRNYVSKSTEQYEPKPFAEPPTEAPRWAVTPPLYRAPYRSKPPSIHGGEHPVNEDPEVLDRFYDRLFGPDGHKWMREEVKWLAITHKSFDHGKRGYNERLAVLGKSILDMQYCLALVNSPQKARKKKHVDELEREPFQHNSLSGLDNLTQISRESAFDKDRMSSLAEHYGLPDVIRWKPRYAGKLKDSGMKSVYTYTMCAIVGALSLEQGGVVANDFVRGHILSKLIPQ